MTVAMLLANTVAGGGAGAGGVTAWRGAPPLYDAHRALGARIVEFAGWEMPVSYSRHRSTSTARCATRVGLFDVSHMGEIEVRGPGARGAVPAS